MAGSAGDLLDPEVCGAGADRNAVVAGLDACTRDGHTGRHLDVDPVGVGASAGGGDLDALQGCAVAAVDHNVVELAVDRCQTTDRYVV